MDLKLVALLVSQPPMFWSKATPSPSYPKNMPQKLVPLLVSQSPMFWSKAPVMRNISLKSVPLLVSQSPIFGLQVGCSLKRILKLSTLLTSHPSMLPCDAVEVGSKQYSLTAARSSSRVENSPVVDVIDSVIGSTVTAGTRFFVSSEVRLSGKTAAVAGSIAIKLTSIHPLVFKNKETQRGSIIVPQKPSSYA